MQSLSDRTQEITNGLNEVIGRLMVDSMRNDGIRVAMERLSEISIKFDLLAEELENEDKKSPEEQEVEEENYVKVYVTQEMEEQMDKCANSECNAEDCIGCCCQICILQI